MTSGIIALQMGDRIRYCSVMHIADHAGDIKCMSFKELEAAFEAMAVIDKSVYLARGSVVTGDVTIGEGCGIWYNAVIRGDEDSVVIGPGSNIQDNAVIHVDRGYPVRIGEGVTVGHGAILHGCTVGDNSLIGMGAIVLNGAVIGRDCIIGAGALVTGGTRIPDGLVAFGNPAVVSPEGASQNRRNALFYRNLAAEALEKEKGHL